jgi:hypothetical protein
VRPLVVPSDPRTVIRKGTLGATTEAGEIVTLQSDGKWDPADASAASICSVASPSQFGGDTDPIDVLLYGPCEVLVDATPGTAIYISDTAGEYSETAGTKSLHHRLRRDGDDSVCQPAAGGAGLKENDIMTLLGNRDTRDNVILTGIDAALLENYRLADGDDLRPGGSDGKRRSPVSMARAGE